MPVRVQAAPPEHWQWLADRAGLALHSGFGAIEAIDDSGRVLGMVGYDGWWPGAVAVHIAIESPIALRHLLRPGFGVAFDAKPRGFDKRAVTATILSSNEKSLKLVRHLGFRHLHTGRDYWGPGRHVEFFEMRREECRFIPRAMRRAA